MRPGPGVPPPGYMPKALPFLIMSMQPQPLQGPLTWLTTSNSLRLQPSPRLEPNLAYTISTMSKTGLSIRSLGRMVGKTWPVQEDQMDHL